MYMNKLLEVSKAENGFVVSCTVPIKPDKKSEGKSMQCCVDESCKQFVAKDESEVAALITKLMPMLDMEYTTEDDFDKAFDKAAGVMEEEDD
jgi:hypothetical protein